ncbi:MAG: DUF262 domain-containing protein [Terracidiphilus sp.]
MAISEITPSAVKIDKLIQRIADGDIKIPAFQRHFVWKTWQVIELLDSIYNDYPIGSILLWNSHDKLKATRNICGFDIPDRPESYPVNYVLDGQQRLSAIYAVFCKNRTQNTEVNDNADLETFDLYFDLDSPRFLSEADLIPDHKSFPLKSLFDMTPFVNLLKQLPDKYHQVVQDLHTRFNNYEVPVVTLKNRTKLEVGIIFERINSTGTKLTTLDLMVAWTWSEDFHLQVKINALLDTLKDKGFDDLPDKTILQCLSAIIQESTSTKSILQLSPESVHNQFDILTSSMEKAIDFLATQLKVTGDFLPHVQQLIPLTFFFSRVNSASNIQSKHLKQWFWKTAFSRRYSAQTDDKLDSDIVYFKQLIDGNYEGAIKYNYTVTTDQLIRQGFTKSSPLVRAFLVLLAQNHPVDLVHGGLVDLGSALSEYNSKEYHHIFPRAHLKKREFLPEKINSLCNFCFLTSDSNKKISNKAPSDYFVTVIPQASLGSILESNLMPLNKEVYDKNDYENFLRLRSQRVMEFLDKQLV